MAALDDNLVITEFLSSLTEKQESLNFLADDLRERRTLAFHSCKDNDTGTPLPIHMRHIATLLEGTVSLVVRCSPLLSIPLSY